MHYLSIEASVQTGILSFIHTHLMANVLLKGRFDTIQPLLFMSRYIPSVDESMSLLQQHESELYE